MRHEIWSKFCGFIDLPLDDFMRVQASYLLEQLDFLGRSDIGRKFLGNKAPRSVEEFRERVPLTSYDDYYPFFSERNDEGLPEKPYVWCRTSGRSGIYPFKWIPFTRQAFNKHSEHAMATVIFGGCSKRGEIVMEPGDTILYALAPRPYMSGAIMADGLVHQFDFNFLPDIKTAEGMSFQDRTKVGFQLALKKGLDFFLGIASVLVAVGERFERGEGGGFSRELLHPATLRRILGGVMKSKVKRREMLPKDVWNLKCVGTGGTDTQVYRKRIAHYWGKEPVEAYGCTEGGIISIQTWGRRGLVFVPDTNFLEFLPVEPPAGPDGITRAQVAAARAVAERNGRGETRAPIRTAGEAVGGTLLLDQLQEGVTYEIVLSNFLGGCLVRYRTGDIVRINTKGDPELGIQIPHMHFFGREQDIIDLSGFTRLTEVILWKALEESGVRYTDWVCRKEYDGDRVFLRLYVEPKEARPEKEIRDLVHEQLREIDHDYAALVEITGRVPLEVTLLPQGAFSGYMAEMARRGVELAHLKPRRMGPPAGNLGLLQRAGAP
ncbi:MAG: GH3 auxin-responsive promoter family protein [Firmicutes bacterium]|nr:GH3 auxin-responsive promoter family protein [Bacillota bacterium]